MPHTQSNILSFTKIALLLLLLIVSGVVFAQNLDPYADVPQTRLEDGGFVLGNPDAAITIVEFADFICPHCQAMKPNIDLFIDSFVKTGQAKFEYRMLPVVDPEWSPKTAQLAECSEILDEGSFWTAHDLLFEIAAAQRFNADSLTEFANAMNLDQAELEACAESAEQVTIDTALAEETGITGTPSFMVRFDDSALQEIETPSVNFGTLYSLVKAVQPEATSDRYADLPASRTDDGAFVLGAEDAPVTIIAFEDFMCPSCQQYEPVMELFVDTYVASGQANLEYRMYPFVDPELSDLSAELAQCADTLMDKGFWYAHDVLFDMTSSGEFRQDDNIAIFAGYLGLDAEAVTECVDSGEMTQHETDIAYGDDTFGVQGTPMIRASVDGSAPDVIVYNAVPYEDGGVPYEVLGWLVQGDKGVELGIEEAEARNPDQLRDTSLVTGEPCSAPCWNNITPGETSFAEAIEIVEASPDEYVNVAIEGPGDGLPQIMTWETPQGQPCCQIYSQDGEEVTAMVFFLAPDMTVAEVVDVYGEPTWVSVQVASQSQASVGLFYPDVPMLIIAYVDGEGGEISESSEILTAAYLTPAEMEATLTASSLVAWDGYMPISEYISPAQ